MCITPLILVEKEQKANEKEGDRVTPGKRAAPEIKGAKISKKNQKPPLSSARWIRTRTGSWVAVTC